MLNQKIGTFISMRRKELGLTQEQLAEKLGISNRSVSRWENGRTLPDYALLQELCSVLQINMAELLTGQPSVGRESAEAYITLGIELMQNEAALRRRQLNRYFGWSLILLLIAALHGTLGILFFIPERSLPAALWLCIGGGCAMAIAGFYNCNRISPISRQEIAVISTPEQILQMKTAEEMLRFSKKYQTGHLKQHKQAFKEIAGNLEAEEYVLFSFIGDQYTNGNHPGPWHISAAVTNKRFLLSGEAMRGAVLPVYRFESFDLKAYKSMQPSSGKLLVQFDDTTIQIAGNNLDSLVNNLKSCLCTK